MDRKIIVTEDNSKTLLIPELNETYHSTHGALNEARHVFINAGLDFFFEKHLEPEINIFEMGFGTGLNAMVTLEYLRNRNLKIDYDTLEKYPLTETEIDQMDYAQLLKDNVAEDLFSKIHQSNWEKSSSINAQFYLKKTQGDLKNHQLDKDRYHLIFFDAFGPRIQPNLWSTEVLEKMHQSLKDNGMLVTYCAQGQFKRNLKSVGFEIENIPGPPGKREMTRATKRIRN